MSSFDFAFLSIALATVGLFFVSCAVVQKKPKHILEEAFGLYRGRLRDLKSSVFKRNQVVLGFVCVVLAAMCALLAPQAEAREGYLAPLGAFAQMAILVVFMAVLCGLLNYLSRFWSKASFKKLVFEVAHEARWPFEDNMTLTREIGSLLGIAPRDDDTVEIYIARIRRHLNLEPREESSESSSPRITHFG